jgi:hypothetical protein
MSIQPIAIDVDGQVAEVVDVVDRGVYLAERVFGPVGRFVPVKPGSIMRMRKAMSGGRLAAKRRAAAGGG